MQLLKFETVVLGRHASFVALETLLQHELEVAEQELIKLGQVMPRILAVKANGGARMMLLGDLMSIPDREECEAAKDGFCAFFRKLARKERFVRYVMTTESWVAEIQDRKNWQREYATLPPSKRENRREIVMVVASEPGRTIGRQREILRGPDGQPTGLGPSPVGEDDFEIGGRFAGLLDED